MGLREHFHAYNCHYKQHTVFLGLSCLGTKISESTPHKPLPS